MSESWLSHLIVLPVLLPLPLAGSYSYLASADDGLAAGDPVIVPFGQRLVWGVVWDSDVGAHGGAVAAARGGQRHRPSHRVHVRLGEGRVRGAGRVNLVRWTIPLPLSRVPLSRVPLRKRCRSVSSSLAVSLFAV